MNRRKDDRKRRPVLRQSDVIREVMLSAGECDTWLTLDELARLTKYPHASISAQLRHLRKPRYGAFVVQKRMREASSVTPTGPGGPIWEYRLSYRIVRRTAAAIARYARML